MAWRENQASRLKNCVKWRSLEARAACVVALIAALVCGIAAAQSRFVLLTVLAASAEVPLALAADVRLNVYVTCDGGDIAGAHLCFAVKQGIITSVDLQLVDDRCQHQIESTSARRSKNTSVGKGRWVDGFACGRGSAR